MPTRTGDIVYRGSDGTPALLAGPLTAVCEMNIIRCISLFTLLTAGVETIDVAYAQAVPPSNPATHAFRITTHAPLPNGLPQNGQGGRVIERGPLIKPREIHYPYGKLGVVQQCEELCFANGAHVLKYLGALSSDKVKSIDVDGSNGGVRARITFGF